MSTTTHTGELYLVRRQSLESQYASVTGYGKGVCCANYNR